MASLPQSPAPQGAVGVARLQAHASAGDGSSGARMRPQGWKSGDRPSNVEVLVPFGGSDETLKDLEAKVFPEREVRFRAVEAGKGVARVM